MLSRVQIREREQIGAWNSDRNIKFAFKKIWQRFTSVWCHDTQHNDTQQI